MHIKLDSQSASRSHCVLDPYEDRNPDHPENKRFLARDTNLLQNIMESGS